MNGTVCVLILKCNISLTNVAAAPAREHSNLHFIWCQIARPSNVGLSGSDWALKSSEKDFWTSSRFYKNKQWHHISAPFSISDSKLEFSNQKSCDQ